MSRSLRDEIRQLAGDTRLVRELAPDDALAVVATLERRFVEHERAVWWWSALRVPSLKLAYGPGDGLDLVRKLVGDAGPVRWLITDDEPAPWPVLEAEATVILDLLPELRFFEYAILDLECRWAVFDTHHNDLVVAGSLLDRARQMGRDGV